MDETSQSESTEWRVKSTEGRTMEKPNFKIIYKKEDITKSRQCS